MAAPNTNTNTNTNTIMHQFNSLREKIAHEKAERAALRIKFRTDIETAWMHATEHVKTVKVEPMLIRNAFTGEVHEVPSGPCGFAHITIRPRTCKLARFAEDELGWRSSNWHKRIELSIQEFGQSHTLKEEFARAFAQKMNELGHNEVGWDSRFD